MKRRKFVSLGFLVLGVFVLGLFWYFLRVDDEKSSGEVVKVIDGDTIIVGKDKVRLIGIDAPEYSAECYATESAVRLRDLVEGLDVRLEKDKSERDKYDRLLRYVFVEDVNINELMVRDGLAKLATYPPDTKYYGKLKAAERVAKESRVGLWGVCPN